MGSTEQDADTLAEQLVMREVPTPEEVSLFLVDHNLEDLLTDVRATGRTSTPRSAHATQRARHAARMPATHCHAAAAADLCECAVPRAAHCLQAMYDAVQNRSKNPLAHMASILQREGQKRETVSSDGRQVLTTGGGNEYVTKPDETAPYNFGPASSRDGVLYTSERPGARPRHLWLYHGCMNA